MKTFIEHLTENEDPKLIMEYINESYDLTEEQERLIDEAVDKLVMEEASGQDIEKVMNDIIQEGLLGSIFGGLTGFALGKSVGKMIAKVLGIQKGVLYDLLTSRLVGAALGAALGKRI
jgi:hypothetical protein